MSQPPASGTLERAGVSVRTRTLDGRNLFVVDGLFEQGLVDLAYLSLKGMPFTLSDTDTKDTRYVIHWKCEFETTKPPALSFITDLWSSVVDTAETLFPDRTLSLGRVHINCSLYGDLQNPHHDFKDSVTALYYANAEWRSDWTGETVFYDDAGEPVYVVAPRPGRVIVFDGNIMHRAGVPSRTCFDPRLTLAFKFIAANK